MHCTKPGNTGDTHLMISALLRSHAITRSRVLCALMWSIFAVAVNSCTTTNSSEQIEEDSTFDAVPPPSFTRGLLTRDEVVPLYPMRARNLGVEGWVMLSFSVSAEGNVLSNTIEIIEEEPDGYFDLSAISAARRLTFDNTRNEQVEDVRYVFRYELEDLPRVSNNSAPVMQFRELIPRRFITPVYPSNAVQQGIEGHVVVQFTVLQDGSVRDISVRESDPPGVFENEALVAASRLRFEPRLIFGVPVIVNNVIYRFDWRLPR